MRDVNVDESHPATGHGSTSPLSLKSRLAERVREAIRVELSRGRWKDRLPPERHLAQEFQVSRPTLHMALSALERDGFLRSDERKPWQIIKTGRPHAQVRVRQPDVVLLRYGRVYADQSTLLLLTDPLRQKLHRLGLGLTIMDPFTKGLQGLSKTLADLDAEHRPMFYVLCSVPPDVHRWFNARRLPALVFGTRAPDVQLPGVDIDHGVTVRHAVEYLLRRGHRRVGFLNHPPIAGGAKMASETFLRSCQEWSHGTVDAIVEATTIRPPALEASVRRMFTRGQPPTAVLTTDVEMTIAVYTLLPQFGLRIPRDVSVLSCWHWPMLDFLWPRTTCYRFSWETIASRMTRIVRNYLHLGSLPDTVTASLPTLSEGGSVASVSRP
jgi:DNA-binding LacI/PurR family transcriptional regulator